MDSSKSNLWVAACRARSRKPDTKHGIAVGSLHPFDQADFIADGPNIAAYHRQPHHEHNESYEHYASRSYQHTSSGVTN